MLARRQPLRQPLLWAFAGGCLSGAVLIGFWRGDPAPVPPFGKQDVLGRTAESAAPPMAKTKGPSESELGKDGRNAGGVEPTSPKGTEDIDSGSPTEAGSSVADVLMHLEDAYRQRLGAAGPVETASTGREPTPTAPDPAQPAAEHAGAPRQATAALLPSVPAHEEAAVAVANTATPPKNVVEAAAAPTDAPASGAQPMLASREEARLRDVYVDNVYQNANVTNAHLGDQYLVQQLALLQYMQLVALSPYAQLASPAYGARGATARRAPAFTSTLTNPDNPWGFAFPPAPLVK